MSRRLIQLLLLATASLLPLQRRGGGIIHTTHTAPPAVTHTAQRLPAVTHTAQRLPAFTHTAQRLPARTAPPRHHPHRTAPSPHFLFAQGPPAVIARHYADAQPPSTTRRSAPPPSSAPCACKLGCSEANLTFLAGEGGLSRSLNRSLARAIGSPRFPVRAGAIIIVAAAASLHP